ncbi:MAG: hypothetical protein KatS3mg111_3387 [Pirellulaceae bacterium]|nr:MAG: hypothetical protein KatS3mg111_3387 [Pirellulaceae bacterium]
MIFVDTGIWFARFAPDDPAHQRVVAWFAANDQTLVTPDYCVDETLTLLVARHHIRRSIEAGRHFFDRSLADLHYLTVDQLHRAWILFQQRAAAGWSFTDCTSKIVIDELGIKTAAVLDEHFRQFGIEVVP